MSSPADVPVREWLRRLEQFGVKLGLETIARITGALDHPERAFQVVHIGGTNGKGSVAAIVAHALRAAGHRTGRYTSPHLVALEERVEIDGQPIAPAALDASLARVRDAVVQLQTSGALSVEPTYFEATTAAAFDALRAAGVEVSVVEVGLGGRFDATTVVTPVLTAITSVDLDHEAQLGGTLTSIAREKAGILKPGVPVVLGALAQEARAIVEAHAAEIGAPLLEAAEVADVRLLEGRTQVALATPWRRYGPLRLGLRGRHQAANAAVAVAVLEALDQRGIAVPAAAIETALADVVWPGRMEIIEATGGRRVLVDGAHNPAGAAAMAEYLREVQPGGLPLVFGAMADKALGPMLAALGAFARPLVLTRAPGRRAAAPELLAAIARRAAPDVETLVVPDPADALEAAWGRGPFIAVGGSLYLAGAVLPMIRSGR